MEDQNGISEYASCLEWATSDTVDLIHKGCTAEELLSEEVLLEDLTSGVEEVAQFCCDVLPEIVDICLFKEFENPELAHLPAVACEVLCADVPVLNHQSSLKLDLIFGFLDKEGPMENRIEYFRKIICTLCMVCPHEIASFLSDEGDDKLLAKFFRRFSHSPIRVCLQTMLFLPTSPRPLGAEPESDGAARIAWWGPPGLLVRFIVKGVLCSNSSDVQFNCSELMNYLLNPPMLSSAECMNRMNFEDGVLPRQPTISPALQRSLHCLERPPICQLLFDYATDNESERKRKFAEMSFADELERVISGPLLSKEKSETESLSVEEEKSAVEAASFDDTPTPRRGNGLFERHLKESKAKCALQILILLLEGHLPVVADEDSSDKGIVLELPGVSHDELKAMMKEPDSCKPPVDSQLLTVTAEYMSKIVAQLELDAPAYSARGYLFGRFGATDPKRGDVAPESKNWGPAVGKKRVLFMQLLSIAVQLSIYHPKVLLDVVLREKVVQIALDLLFRYPHNNLLHSAIVDTLVPAITAPKAVFETALFTDGKLIERILEGYEIAKGGKASFLGFLHELANSVACVNPKEGSSTQPPLVWKLTLVAENQAWLEFATTELSEINRKETTMIGAYASGLSEMDTSGEDLYDQWMDHAPAMMSWTGQEKNDANGGAEFLTYMDMPWESDKDTPANGQIFSDAVFDIFGLEEGQTQEQPPASDSDEFWLSLGGQEGNKSQDPIEAEPREQFESLGVDVGDKSADFAASDDFSQMLTDMGFAEVQQAPPPVPPPLVSRETNTPPQPLESPQPTVLDAGDSPEIPMGGPAFRFHDVNQDGDGDEN